MKLLTHTAFFLTLLLALTGCNENVRISLENSKVLHDYSRATAEKLLGKEEVRELSDESITDLENIAKSNTSGKAALEPVADWLKLDAEFLSIGEAPHVEADVTVDSLEENLDRGLGAIDARTRAAQKEVNHSFYKKWQNSKAALVSGGISAAIMSIVMAYIGASKFSGLKKLVVEKSKESEDHKNVAKINAHYAKNMEEEAERLASRTKEVLKDPEKHKDVDLEQEFKTKVTQHRQSSATQQQRHNVADKMGTVLTEVKVERTAN